MAVPMSAVEVWRRWADDVTGQEIACGHFLPEEAPDAVLTALLSFLDQEARCMTWSNDTARERGT